MINILLFIIPVLGILILSTNNLQEKTCKTIGLITSSVNFFIVLVLFIVFDFSSIENQFVQEVYELNSPNLFFGIDGISIYFILLTSFITPIVIMSN
jgi:NADH-ubiquinone oxidoreductase chain 4